VQEENGARSPRLHDEFGQCLTASMAFARRLKRRERDRPDLARTARHRARRQPNDDDIA